MIRLPRHMTKSDLLACLGVADALVHNADKVIHLDASELRFIDPFGLTLLAAASERAGQGGGLGDFVRPKPTH